MDTSTNTTQNTTDELISAELRKRLQVQEELLTYLENNQVLSWCDKPHKGHVNKLQLVASAEANPRGYMHCVLL